MSSISAVGSASSAWSGLASSRMGAMKEKMFSKVDSDGSGTVDTGELQTMLDHVRGSSGTSLGSADELLGKMDSDGDGGLSMDELDAGMRSLMPAPSSTLDFAQQRAGGMRSPPPGPPPGGSAGPGAAGGATSEASGASSSSTSTDPMDTNGDGTVSAAERMAAELGQLVQDLASAMDGDGDGSISASEVKDFSKQLRSAMRGDSPSMSQVMQKAYGDTSTNAGSADGSSSLRLAA